MCFHLLMKVRAADASPTHTATHPPTHLRQPNAGRWARLRPLCCLIALVVTLVLVFTPEFARDVYRVLYVKKGQPTHDPLWPEGMEFDVLFYVR